MSFLSSNDDARPWKGAYTPYDLVKELAIAVGSSLCWRSCSLLFLTR